jgi:hypothetical protein
MNAKKPPSELFHQLFCNKGPPKQKNRKLPEKPVKVRSPKISIIIEPEFMQVGVWFFKPQCRSIGIMYQSRIIGTIIKKLIGVKPVLTKPPPISINDLHDIPGRFKKFDGLAKTFTPTGKCRQRVGRVPGVRGLKSLSNRPKGNRNAL